MDGSILLKNWAYGKRKMSIDTRQCTRKSSQSIDSNEENELVCVCDSQTQAFPSRGIAPSRHSVGLALLQRYSLRSRAHDRPHVSLSEALLSAFASCGIPPDTPYGWHLLPLRRESTYQVTPFPGSIVRIRRTVLSTGFLWQCKPVSGFGCRRPILCPFGSSVSASYAG
jgi:hypothetical protein